MNTEMIEKLHDLAESMVIAYSGDVDRVSLNQVKNAILLKFPNLNEDELYDASNWMWDFMYDLAEQFDAQYYRDPVEL